MIQNNLCEICKHSTVCRNKDILYKFDESAKKDLEIDITLNTCGNYEQHRQETV